jgi:hypothetical protein
VKFTDPIETAREMVMLLRETEKVDVVIALSHGGMTKGADGRFIDGEDVQLPKAVPGIDVVIGAHSHTELHEAIIVNGRTPVVQTGKYGENLGELVISSTAKLTVNPTSCSGGRHDFRRQGHPDEIGSSNRPSQGRVRLAVTASIKPLAIAPRASQHLHRHRRRAPCWQTFAPTPTPAPRKADIGYSRHA